MAYFLWIMACVSDIVLLVAMWTVVHYGGNGGWLFVVLGFGAWRRGGGLDNWRPSIIRQYFKNARRLGL